MGQLLPSITHTKYVCKNTHFAAGTEAQPSRSSSQATRPQFLEDQGLKRREQVWQVTSRFPTSWYSGPESPPLTCGLDLVTCFEPTEHGKGDGLSFSWSDYKRWWLGSKPSPLLALMKHVAVSAKLVGKVLRARRPSCRQPWGTACCQ